MTLSGCTTLCPLDKFISLTKDVVPEDWERECLISSDQYAHSIGTTSIIGKINLNFLIR